MDKTKITTRVFNSCAKAYQEKFMDVDLYKTSFDLFCDSIKKKEAKILEIGCGPGNITKYLLTKQPQWKITGTDLAENMIALAKINNPQAAFKLMDCRHLGELEEKYDGIMGGFCLPYLSKEEVEKLIEDASHLLKADGVLYLSTMEDAYSKSGLKKSSSGEYEMFIHFHEADYLTHSLKFNEFKIINLQRIKYNGQDGMPVTDLIIVASK